MTGYTAPRIYTVEPGLPFLATLAHSLCNGELVPGFSFDGNPLNLARARIYVPTRRAARELRSAFMDALGKQSVLLPVIKTLGEFDEEAALFDGSAETFVRTPPPIDALERQLMLGRMIAGWTKHLEAYLQNYFNGEEFTTPVSTADAFWMARDLAGLLDQLQTEDLSFEDIQAAADAETSDWWKITLGFLQIIKDEWPKVLEERRRIDPAAHRNAMLRGEAERLAALKPTDPVIVAGSTGTIPATADLIATIAKLPGGAVVLPGYDLSMSTKTQSLLEEPDDVASAIGHPQYGMHNLVKRIGGSGIVEPLGSAVSQAQTERKLWVAAALEPAPETRIWNSVRANLKPSAFDHVALMIANNEREEAAGIAAALREAIANPETTTALVTPDRVLARRVVSELAKFGIQADDSGGTSFDTTAHGSLVSFTFKVALDQQKDPAALLALLKNRLVKVGIERAEFLQGLKWLELLVLRGGVDRIDLANFAAFAEAQLAAWDERNYKPSYLKDVTADDREIVGRFALAIEDAFSPLVAFAEHEGDTRLELALDATIKTLEALCADETGNHSALYEDEAGALLRGVLTQFLTSDTDLAFNAAQWPEIFRAISSTMLVKPKVGGHPRVSIWGALEARLQSVDFLVLGALNEGTWPQQTSNDAFLTRGMKTKMNMQPPERRIGLAAHDFQMGMGQANILLTRSERVESAPAVASRWVQRLETLAGAQATETMRTRGRRFLQLAHALETPKAEKFVERPEPKPPLADRPTNFSVTEIERLRRDPYAIYAKKILGLYQMEPLLRDPDAATRGTLIHAILEDVSKSDIDFSTDDAAARILKIADAVFAKEALPQDIEIIWKARFSAAIPALIAWELERQEQGVTRFAELQSSSIDIGDTGVSLRGRADRLDKRLDGTVDIIDFKTGSAPTAKQVRTLLSPQMPLEAALLRRNGFSELRDTQAGELLYVKIGNAGAVEPNDVRGKNKNFIDANELAENAWKKLIGIMAFYNNADNGYVSRSIPKLEHDYSDEYDHLARVMEWSSGVGNDGDAS